MIPKRTTDLIHKREVLTRIVSECAKTDLQIFCKAFLTNHFLLDFSALHKILFHEMNKTDYNRRLVIKAPRKSGKTTLVVLGYALWSLATKRRKFLLYIKETDGKAKSDVKKIRREIESNGMLIKTFPGLIPKRGKLIKRWEKLSDNMIYFDNGTIVAAFGKDSALRGINELGQRPDCIIYDDPQGNKEKESINLQEKDNENFDTEIRNLGGPGQSLDIILIGTMISFGCLIEYVANKPGWEKIEVDAV